ncbi:hypothetical protein ACFWU5_21395 [Nocardia sp. NPDC058640]|uniref:hypothetical protein n=1 Tax=Nocardia sp. NPDC058640 TaxID=3346571 RepID=UPI00364628A0
MKAVMVGASIAAAIMMSGAGVAAAQAPVHGVQQVAGPSTGSGDLGGQLYSLVAQLAGGSSQPCDGILLDTCIPVGTATP